MAPRLPLPRWGCQARPPRASLPLTAPARCHGGGSAGRSRPRGCPSRLPGGRLPWRSTRCANPDGPGNQTTRWPAARPPPRTCPTLTTRETPELHGSRSEVLPLGTAGSLLCSAPSGFTEAEAVLRPVSFPELPSPQPGADANPHLSSSPSELLSQGLGDWGAVSSGSVSCSEPQSIGTRGLQGAPATPSPSQGWADGGPRGRHLPEAREAQRRQSPGRGSPAVLW